MANTDMQILIGAKTPDSIQRIRADLEPAFDRNPLRLRVKIDPASLTQMRSELSKLTASVTSGTKAGQKNPFEQLLGQFSSSFKTGTKENLGTMLTSILNGASIKTAFKDTLRSLASSALSSGVSAVASVVINLVATGIDHLVNAKKYAEQAKQKLLQSGQTVTDALNEQRASLKSNKSVIDSISADYQRLSLGVDHLGNNVSLTADEYARYNGIVNQIAGMFPQLVQGYTDEGNAILTAKGNIEALTEAYEEQQEAYQNSILTNAKTSYAAYNAALQSSGSGRTLQFGLIEQIEGLTSFMDLLSKGREAFYDDYYDGDFFDDRKYSNLKKAFKAAGLEIAPTRISGEEELYDYYQSVLPALTAQLRAFVREVNTETAKIKPILSAFLSQDYTFQALTEENQALISQLTSLFDYQFFRNFSNETDMYTWISNNLIAPLRDPATAVQMQNALSALFQSDMTSMSASAYQELISSLLATLPEEVRLKIAPYFEVDVETLYQQAKEKLGDIPELGTLTYAELQTVLEPEFSFDPASGQRLDAAIAAFIAAHTVAPVDTPLSLRERLDAYSDPNILAETLAQLKKDGLDTFLTEDTLNTLLSQYPELIDELDAYADAMDDAGAHTEAAADLQEALNSALGAFEGRRNAQAFNDLSEAVETYGADSYQAISAAETLVRYLPMLRDVLYDAETGTWNLSTAAQDSAVALLKQAQATMQAELAAKQANLSSLTTALEDVEARATSASYAMFGFFESERIRLMGQKFRTLKDIFQLQQQLTSAGTFFAGLSAPASAGSTSDPWKEEFEREYAAWQHKVKMEQATQQEFLTWLDKAYKQYFGGDLTRYLDEYRKYAEEVFTGLRALSEDWAGNQAHQIFLLEKQGGQESKIQDMYRAMQAYVHEEADAYRARQKALGIADEVIESSEYIQSLSKQWWSYEDAIRQIEEKRLNSVRELVGLTENMVRQEQETHIDILTQQVEAFTRLVELRKQSLQLAERERSYQQEVGDAVSEIADLQRRIDSLALDDSRAAAVERGALLEQLADKQGALEALQRENAITAQEEALDAELDAFQDTKEAEIDRIEEFLNDSQRLTQAALERINARGGALFDDLLAYAQRYTDTTQAELEAMWGAAMEAAREYGSIVAALNGTPDTAAQIPGLVDRMRGNSAKWYPGIQSQDPALWTQLQKAQRELADQIAALTGRKVWLDAASGVWYIGDKKLYDEYPVGRYHSGGLVGGSPTQRQGEVLALLEDGEIVANTAQQTSLLDRFNRFVEQSAAVGRFSGLLSSFLPSGSAPGWLQAGLSPACAGAAARPGVPIQVDASIDIYGYADDNILDTLARHQRKVADMVAQQFGGR